MTPDTRHPTPDTPNILFIFADQMHRYAMGCMGNKDVKTPTLDRLAAEGMLFTQAYSNCPICTPFRGNLFTGRHSSSTGVLRNSEGIPVGMRTLAGALNDGGYQTSYVGKWHLGGGGNGPIAEELRADFQHFIGYQCYNGYFKDVCFYDESGQEHRYDRHRTDVTTDIAIERLEAISDNPFALFVSYQNPHYPEQPSPEYAALYEGLVPTKRPNFSNIDPYTPTCSPPSPKPIETCPDFQAYGNNIDAYMRLYYAMVSQMDAGIARLLDALDRLGLRDNTAIVFTSDHGDMQGSHGLTNKCHPHEESAGIPLIVQVPGGATGVTTDALVSGVDFMPTCLDWAGLPPEPTIEGRSFAPLTRGKDQDLTGPVFSEKCDQWRMIRKGAWKLVGNWDVTEATLMFNMNEDPYEMNNRLTDPAAANIRTTLLKELQDWTQQMTDKRNQETAKT